MTHLSTLYTNQLRVSLFNLTSGFSWPLMMVGLILIGAGNVSTGNLLFNIAVIMFVVVVLFHTVTLPVELDASKRALAQLSEGDAAAEEAATEEDAAE